MNTSSVVLSLRRHEGPQPVFMSSVVADVHRCRGDNSPRLFLVRESDGGHYAHARDDPGLTLSAIHLRQIADWLDEFDSEEVT